MKKPGWFTLMVGLLVLAFGVITIAKGGEPMWLAIGVSMSVAGYCGVAMKTDSVDVVLMSFMVIGALMFGLHQVASHGGHHEAAAHAGAAEAGSEGAAPAEH